MSARPRVLLGILAWGALAYGVLRLSDVPGECGTDELSGPWG